MLLFFQFVLFGLDETEGLVIEGLCFLSVVPPVLDAGHPSSLTPYRNAMVFPSQGTSRFINRLREVQSMTFYGS